MAVTPNLTKQKPRESDAGISGKLSIFLDGRQKGWATEADY